MAEEKSYEELLAEKENLENQKKSSEEKQEEYSYILSRLNRAKESIAELKKSFQANKKKDEEIEVNSENWSGSCCDEFKTKLSTLKEENNNYYSNTLDYVLDSLNNEITRVENLNLEQGNIFSWVLQRLNELANKIENWTN